MSFSQLKRFFSRNEQIVFLSFLAKWSLISLLIGLLAGSASAFFLVSLEWATNYREANTWIIFLLPLAGLLIGWIYHQYGQDVLKGNNQLLEEYHRPRKVIPFKMAPLVLFGTIATHLFGGSAGREGTAVQMGGAIADQFTRIFRLKNRDRKILLVMGISAGFASVFGTPLAGAIFALEVMIIGRIRYEAILPSFLVAVVADWTCHAWQVKHTHYEIPFVPTLDPQTFLWALLAGIFFGLAALLFAVVTHFWGNAFRRFVAYPPLRPVLGGVVIALAVWWLGSTRYIGLGVPVIVESFSADIPWYDFLAKTIFTSFTLGAGFKGGEVTPLFFVGATLGNALSGFIPLPVALLAGMGFVGVFSGATNTPIACTVMGIELFGIEAGVFLALACTVAFLFSGHNGIYGAQIVGSPKHALFARKKGRMLL